MKAMMEHAMLANKNVVRDFNIEYGRRNRERRGVLMRVQLGQTLLNYNSVKALLTVAELSHMQRLELARLMPAISNAPPARV
jgi:hypothetical protein